MSQSKESPQSTGHESEPHNGGVSGRLNWLRAGVLGANDGIVSVAGMVVGVAGATSDRAAIFTAGSAGLVAGALSMAGGEYVSVSTQRDTERALLDKEQRELDTMPADELEELAGIYRAKGISDELAHEVARQLTSHDALAAHAEAELGLSTDELTNPWQAAWASFVAFTLGGLLPMLAIMLPPPSARVVVCFISVIIALALTGYVSARLGQAPTRPAVIRNVLVGAISMAITYGVGVALGGFV